MVLRTTAALREAARTQNARYRCRLCWLVVLRWRRRRCFDVFEEIYLVKKPWWEAVRKQNFRYRTCFLACCEHLMIPRGRWIELQNQDAPKMEPRWGNMAPRCANVAPRCANVAPRCTNVAPRWPWWTLDGAKMSQCGTKTRQFCECFTFWSLHPSQVWNCRRQILQNAERYLFYCKKSSRNDIIFAYRLELLEI